MCLCVRCSRSTGSWLIHICDMTHSCMWHDSFLCVTWPIHTRDMTKALEAGAYSRWTGSWLIHMCDMTHSYVRSDSFIRVTWLTEEFNRLRGPWRCGHLVEHMLTRFFWGAHSGKNCWENSPLSRIFGQAERKRPDRGGVNMGWLRLVGSLKL